MGPPPAARPSSPARFQCNRTEPNVDCDPSNPTQRGLFNETRNSKRHSDAPHSKWTPMTALASLDDFLYLPDVLYLIILV